MHGHLLARAAFASDLICVAVLTSMLWNRGSDVAVPSVLVAALVLATSASAMARPKLGIAALPLRAVLALAFSIAALVNPLFWTAVVLCAVSALLGLVAADVGATPTPFGGVITMSLEVPTAATPRAPRRCPRCDAEHRLTTPVCATCVVRRDERVSAALYFGATAAVTVSLLLQDRLLAAGGVWMVVVGIASPAAVHEAGHAIAAEAVGAEVRSVQVGVGLRLLTLGRWTIRALPFGGLTLWEAESAPLTRHRTGAILLAGSAANVLAALLCLGAAAASGLPFLGVLAMTHAATGALNLIPWPRPLAAAGHPADGRQLLHLYRTRRN